MYDISHQETKALAKQIEDENPDELLVPSNLSSHHHLIIKAKRHFATAKTPNFYHHLDWDLGILAIHVTKNTISRSIRFFNSFIKLSISRGHDIRIKDTGTFIVIRDRSLKIRLRETARYIQEPEEKTWDWQSTIPTGNLCFSYETYYSWGGGCTEWMY
ncbi:hypothetical protein [uncultured Marivirga sp.]|uniref:hypothetical protein n=1 Tax=uncultured Marivirga sp. TaxID=1123707 RepID=UPI0030ED6F7A|tara:strand:+ start:26214 stop:26690 length:477 start_codon:yes stop_codon:yes gene_type:complete